MCRTLSGAAMALALLGSWCAGASAGRAGSASQDAGYLYLSPVPDAPYVSPQTEYVLVRFVDVVPAAVTNLASGFATVTGSVSGVHLAAVDVASDGRTVVVQPEGGFTPDEVVRVTLDPHLAPGAAGTADAFAYDFAVSAPMPGPIPSSDPPRPKPVPQPMQADPPVPADVSYPSGPLIMPNGVSIPSGFPHIDITIHEDPDPGYIFLDNRKSGGSSYNVIFDNNGWPIWYWQTSDERRDMKVQQNELLTMLARNGGMRFIGLDTNYVQVAEYRAVNGYETDEHELVVLADGAYFLLGRRNNQVDMSLYVSGGQSSVTVRETVLQEFTPDGQLIFQWRGWDHLDIRDNHLDFPTTGGTIRFPHMNAIEEDTDGHLLVSSRHQSQVTKIDRDSGEVIWRLGGAGNDFTFVGDALGGISCQHAIRALGNNRYTLFDNGNYHSPQVSRAVEYELDTSNNTATVVWEFRDTPDRYSHYMSNAQRLPNGNTLINWALGSSPKLTEVRPDGTKAYEMNWADNSQAYRVWRHPWQGVAIRPYLFAEAGASRVTLIYNQFGDTDIDYYRIYGGTTPAPTNLLATSNVTLCHLTDLVSGERYYFRVTAVHGDGSEGAYSNEESVDVNFVAPGANLVRNGDFAQGEDDWIFELQGSGDAVWSVSGGVSSFLIANGGTRIYDVQLRQAGIPLEQGLVYEFAFEAWSTGRPRILEAKVGQDSSPFFNYSGIQPFQITPNPTPYTFEFTMTEPSDPDARVAFNAGADTPDVHIRNVTLRQLVFAPGDFDRDGCVSFHDLETFTDDWADTGSLIPDLNGDGKVDFADFVMFSADWAPGGFCP